MAVMTTSNGAKVIARALRDLGVTVIFGLVGIPIVDIAEEAINLGIRFIAQLRRHSLWLPHRQTRGLPAHRWPWCPPCYGRGKFRFPLTSLAHFVTDR